MARSVKRVVTQTSATLTLNDGDDGITVIAGVADLIVTLPAVSKRNKGMVVKGFTSTLSVTTGFSFSPAAADKIRGATVAGVALAGVDDKDVINTAATDVAGDRIELTSDGVDGWIITGLGGIWAAEA